MRVRVESDAEEELTAAAEWYESKRTGLGVESSSRLSTAHSRPSSPRPSLIHFGGPLGRIG